MQSAGNGTQNLVESHPTFTLNVELYRLTVLAMKEIFGRHQNPPAGFKQENGDCDFQSEEWKLENSPMAMTKAEVSPRSYIDIALMADTTQTR